MCILYLSLSVLILANKGLVISSRALVGALFVLVKNVTQRQAPLVCFGLWGSDLGMHIPVSRGRQAVSIQATPASMWNNTNDGRRPHLEKNPGKIIICIKKLTHDYSRPFDCNFLFSVFFIPVHSFLPFLYYACKHNFCLFCELILPNFIFVFLKALNKILLVLPKTMVFSLGYPDICITNNKLDSILVI